MSPTPSASSRPGDPVALLKPSVVARRLGVSPRTVQRWAASGRIRSTRTPGGELRISSSDVDRLAEPT